MFLVGAERDAGDLADFDAEVRDSGLAGFQAVGVAEGEGDLERVLLSEIVEIIAGHGGGEEGDEPDEEGPAHLFEDWFGERAVHIAASSFSQMSWGSKLADAKMVKTTTMEKAINPLPGMMVARRWSLTSDTRTAMTKTSSIAQRPMTSMIR